LSLAFSMPRPIGALDVAGSEPACSCAATSSLRVGSLMGDLTPFCCLEGGCCHARVAPFTEGLGASLLVDIMSICLVGDNEAASDGFCRSGELRDLA